MVLKNYIEEYNSDGGKTTTKERQKEAYSFFINKGYSPEQSAGIVGNLIQESGFDLKTHVKGFDGTGSTGMAQWLGSRLDRLKQVQGDNWNTFKGQLEFIDWELKNTEKRAAEKLNSSKTAEDAALAFSKYYERPHKDYAHNEKRKQYASDLLKEFTRESPVAVQQPKNREVKTTTQDSLDPNNYMVDIMAEPIVEQTVKNTSQEVLDLQKIFQMEATRKNKEKDFVSRLKTISESSPIDTQQQYNQEQNLINQQFDQSLYNYININEY